MSDERWRESKIKERNPNDERGPHPLSTTEKRMSLDRWIQAAVFTSVIHQVSNKESVKQAEPLDSPSFIMFQRKNSASLPTTMSPMTLPTGGGNDYSKDGSGKAIKMDAPVVKAWKHASSSTKYSYYILGACFFSIFMGYR